MITYLIGNPGSGKTYYAVYKIYELFLYVPKPSIFDKFKKLPLPINPKSNQEELKEPVFNLRYIFTGFIALLYVFLANREN